LLAARCEGKAKGDFVFNAPEGGPIRNKNFCARRFEPAMAKMLELHADWCGSPRTTFASQRQASQSRLVPTSRRSRSCSATRPRLLTLGVYADLFDDDLDAVGDALGAAGSPEAVGKMWARDETGPRTVIAMKKKS
jgi:hypothetical protein